MTAKASSRRNSLDVSILNSAKHIGNRLDMSGCAGTLVFSRVRRRFLYTTTEHKDLHARDTNRAIAPRIHHRCPRHTHTASERLGDKNAVFANPTERQTGETRGWRKPSRRPLGVPAPLPLFRFDVGGGGRPISVAICPARQDGQR